MALKRAGNIWFWFCGCIAGTFFISAIQSCGKSSASPQGLNIQYEVLNLSPDLGQVALFVNFLQVNSTSNGYTFGVNQGYFYVPSIDTPYQFRPFILNGTSADTLFSRHDILKTGLKYSLFITGTFTGNQLKQIFTVDTAASPAVGTGKIRFINASPAATGGLDLYLNGTLSPSLTGIGYPKTTGYVQVPVGNYDVQIKGTNTTSVLNDQPIVTIQDGRLYTIYAYGYTSRTDSAAFNAGIITNR